MNKFVYYSTIFIFKFLNFNLITTPLHLLRMQSFEKLLNIFVTYIRVILKHASERI